MIQLTLLDKQNQKVKLPLSLPISVFPSGRATVVFTTKNQTLNNALATYLSAEVDSNSKELHLLAYLLKRMDESSLMLMTRHLPNGSSNIRHLVDLASYITEYYSDEDGRRNPTRIPLSKFARIREDEDITDQLTSEFRRDIKTQRVSGAELFSAIVERAKQNGDLKDTNSICDYILATDYDSSWITNYEFDFVATPTFGGSEGIYVDCALSGKFDNSGRTFMKVGTVKTLNTDLSACKIMGELCGILLYHCDRYVNEKLDLFSPIKEIEKTLANRAKRESIAQNQIN